MKFIIVAALFLFACDGQSANVISVDGATKLAYCASGNWIDCVSKACPNGFSIVDAPFCTYCTGIVKCKPSNQ